MDRNQMEALQRVEEMADNAFELSAVLADLRSIAAICAYTKHNPILHGVCLIAKHASEYARDAESRMRSIKSIAISAQEAPEAVQVEDRQAILDALLPAGRLTRQGDEAERITLRDDGFAEIHFPQDKVIPVNVDGDSGLAMIRDVCKALM